MTFIIYNDTYSVSETVKEVHQILHLNSHGQSSSTDFGITISSTWNDYTKSLLPIPIICMSIALLALFIFEMWACCACCCRTEVDDDLPLVQRRAKPVDYSLRYYRIGFLVFLIILVGFDQSILFGNKYLTNGVSNADDGLNYLESTFTDLNDYGDVLLADGYLLQDDFTNAYVKDNCQQANTLNSYLADYFSYVQDYQSYVADVPDKCNNAQDALHTYGVTYKNKTVWVFYAMFLVTAGIYTIGMVLSNKWVIFGGFCCAELVMTFTFILCGVVMILLVSCHCEYFVLVSYQILFIIIMLWLLCIYLRCWWRTSA